jgi:hypothetical protein
MTQQEKKSLYLLKKLSPSRNLDTTNFAKTPNLLLAQRGFLTPNTLAQRDTLLQIPHSIPIHSATTFIKLSSNLMKSTSMSQAKRTENTNPLPQ